MLDDLYRGVYILYIELMYIVVVELFGFEIFFVRN